MQFDATVPPGTKFACGKVPYLEISHIPHLHLLDSRIRQGYPKVDYKVADVESLLEQLAYNLSSAGHALVKLCEAQHDAIELVRCRRSVPNKPGFEVYMLEHFEYRPMAFALDAFLDSAGRAQNSVWVYISKILKKSVPKSLADIVKNIDSGRLDLPQPVRDIVTAYWKASGQTLRSYRDLAQHHVVCTTDGRVIFMPDGSERVHLLLPNNPQEKKISKLKYEKPAIHALFYVIDSFAFLMQFCLELTHVLLSYTTVPKCEKLIISFKGGVTSGPDPGGDKVPTLQAVLGDILKINSEFQARLDAELPRNGIAPTLVIPSETAPD